MRAEKQQIVQDIRVILEPSQHLFVVTYKGLTVDDFANLRQALAGVGAECHVVPNRLFLRAAAEMERGDLGSMELVGDSAMVCGGDDPAKVAKTLRDFSKDSPGLAFKAGFVDGKLCSPEEVLVLADLPPIDVLRAQLLGVLQGTPRQLVSVLNAKVASIIYVLNSYLDKKEKSN